MGNKEWKKNHAFDSCVVATMVSKIQYKQLVLGDSFECQNGAQMEEKKAEVYQEAFYCYSCLSLIDWCLTSR